ncbi:MAG: glutathione S-transferase family protein, partial [Gammaproteobacteria bacterium]|nr:glutathione S-transferase family protein [Gammaproteobacteria bacterium]
MGLLIEGQWHTDWYDTESNNGEFVRKDSQFRDWIGSDAYPAEAGRYHLFVSLACPWAHRTLIFRKLKKLEQVIGVTVVKAEMLDKGWEISDEVSVAAGYDASPVVGIATLAQVYTKADSSYSGRVTVPVLWDTQTNTIVSNESADIIRMLNSAFEDFTEDQADYYPQALAADIDQVNELVYEHINNGVYRAGFATTQAAYEKAFHQLFKALATVEGILEAGRYLLGDHMTEADWRLFTTLIRFDSVYFGHFKTNLRQIESYPNISNYVRELYQHA